MSQTDAPLPGVEPGARTPPTPGLLSRVIGVVVSPVETLGHVARDPRPLGMLAFVTIASAVVSTVFFTTEVGQLAWMDTAISQQEAFGVVPSDAQYEQMERMAGLMVYITPAYTLIFGPLFTLAIAGILKVAFTIITGAEGTFKQTIDVVATSSVIVLLRSLFVLPLNYVQESMTSATNLGVLLPMLDPGGFPARSLGMIDVFFVWWVAVLAVGLAVVFRRRVRPVAVALFSIYGVIALAIALVLSWVGGS